MRAFVHSLCVLVVLGAATAFADAAPQIGDATRGAQLYRLNCAACHGPKGEGAGVMSRSLPVEAGNVRGTALQVTLTDSDLHDVVANGGPALKLSKFMPGFAGELSELEIWDVVAWMRDGSYAVTDFFPSAGRYLVKRYTLDQYAIERLTKALGAAPSKADSDIEVVTAFNGERQPGSPATLEPQDPVTLDSLKPKDRIGYVAFVNAQLTGDSRALPVAIAVDRDGKIVKAVSITGANDAARDRLLAGYVGQGKKGPHVALTPPKPAKGKKAAKAAPADAPLTGFDAAYARAMEGVTQYDKEEKDRTWADSK